MSVEIVVNGRCACGLVICAGAEDRARQDADGTFWCCRRCGAIEGKRGACAQCGVPREEWDERTCPRCGASPELHWGTAYN
jgi:hypothetical protein